MPPRARFDPAGSALCVRLIGRDPWFSAAAILALALGIGVDGIGFTIVNAAFLRGLPFPGADRLYMLSWQGRPGRRSVSHADLQDWRAQSRTFTDLAGFRNGAINLSDDRGLPEQLRGTWVASHRGQGPRGHRSRRDLSARPIRHVAVDRGRRPS